MKIGSLFSGVAGLDRAVEAVTGATPAWFVEFDPAPSKVLARHYPDIPNYGDVTTVDWAALEPIDILTAGYPCQPFSHAGKRKGTDDERHLWPYVEVAIGVLRPGLVVLENVAGHLTLGGPTVIGSLTALGYDARWGVVRASDAGAPHRRARLFIVAHPHSVDDDGTWLPGKRGGLNLQTAIAENTDRATRDERRLAAPREAQGGRSRANTGGPSGVGTVNLLPTPVVNDMGNGKTPPNGTGGPLT